MATTNLTSIFLEELKRETLSTRKCLENLTTESFDFKPHETAMEMRYLALLVAEIPLWIAWMIEKGEIDFATYPKFEFETPEELLAHFEDSLKKAETALSKIVDDDLDKSFSLKRDGKTLYSSPLKIDIPTTLNHWVHHRGQLTVYMRINEIKVPSIYGPSGDDNHY